MKGRDFNFSNLRIRGIDLKVHTRHIHNRLASLTIFYKQKPLVSDQIIGNILCLCISVIGTDCVAKIQKVPCKTSNSVTHVLSARIYFAFSLDLIWLFSMQGYLLFRTIHNLLRAVLISKKSEDFLVPSPGWMFPGRIFQKNPWCGWDGTNSLPLNILSFGLAVSPQQFDPHVHARSLW